MGTKRNTLMAMLMLLMATGTSAKTYCIFTAVSNYVERIGENSKDLRASSDDAKRLTKQYRRMGAEVCLLTGEHATGGEILAQIDTLSRISKPEDQIVFFFSGHGAAEYIVTYDDKDMLSYYRLFEALRKVPCSKVIVYIDACYSGTMYSNKKIEDGSEMLTYEFQLHKGDNEKFIIMCSSRNDERSWELGPKGGLFTKALIDGLKGKADTDNNKELTTFELFNYVYYNVVGHKLENGEKQHPQLFTDTTKNMNFVISKLEK